MTKWLDIARRYEGEAEVAGPGSNPVILAWINYNGRPDAKDDSAIAWCGFFMAAVFIEAGLGPAIPKEPGAAASWRTCGVPLKEPRVGAIVVMSRADPNNTNAAHVGLIEQVTDDVIWVLAGNQGNRVSVMPFSYVCENSFIYRWPVAEATPAALAAKGSRIAAAAQRQKRDAAVSGTASGSTQVLPTPEAASVDSGLAGIRQAVDGALQDVTWAKGVWAQVLDFAAFAGVHWRWAALAVAAWYGLRFVYDSHMIGLWRAQDHNEGRNMVTPAGPQETSP